MKLWLLFVNRVCPLYYGRIRFFQIIDALYTIEWGYNQRSASIYPLISCLLYLICSKQ